MKIRIIRVSLLAVLVSSNLSWPQAAGVTEEVLQKPVFKVLQKPVLEVLEKPVFQELELQDLTQATPLLEEPVLQAIPPLKPPLRRQDILYSQYRAQDPTEVRIFSLKYIRLGDAQNVIYSVLRIRVHAEARTNRLIVNATREQLKSVESLLMEIDVPGSEASKPREIQNLTYRVYMFEIPSGDQRLKSFSMILQTPARVSSQDLLNAERADLQISELLQSDQKPREQETEFLIQGKASGNASLVRMLDMIHESRIVELNWDDDESFTDTIAAAQSTQLPEQLQKHIHKFLGNDIRTVGYWFGDSSSIPGTVQAPIGPWKLRLQLKAASDRSIELNVDVEAPEEMHRFDRRLGRPRTGKILSNSIRAKTGQPIIIGYNRDSYGTRKMGAMVIIPEADSVQSPSAATTY